MKNFYKVSIVLAVLALSCDVFAGYKTRKTGFSYSGKKYPPKEEAIKEVKKEEKKNRQASPDIKKPETEVGLKLTPEEQAKHDAWVQKNIEFNKKVYDWKAKAQEGICTEEQAEEEILKLETERLEKRRQENKERRAKVIEKLKARAKEKKAQNGDSNDTKKEQ